MSVSFNKKFIVSILNGATDSVAIRSSLYYEDMVAMMIAGPAALTGAITIQINSLEDGTGVWTTLQDDTPADIAGPLAGKARWYPRLVGTPCFRLHSTLAEGAQRDFVISGQWTTGH